MARTHAEKRGIINKNQRLKMTNYKSIEQMGDNFKHYRDLIWFLVEDDGSTCPYFTSEDGRHTHLCMFVDDFTPVDDLIELEQQAVDVDGYTKNQRYAVQTFSTMLERAKLYREKGSRDGFDPESGICDNISDCRPQGASYDDMYRVKDNIIRAVPSYSGSYHYPVKHPDGGDAESAWDNNCNKWAGDYGAQRVIQLEELIDYVKNNWNENLVKVLTPAQQRGIVLMKTLCQHVPTGILWLMQYDDDTQSPFFIPLGNEGRDGRKEIHLNDILVLTNADSDCEKRSVRSFVAKAKRIENKQDKLRVKIAKLQAAIDKLNSEIGTLKGDFAMNDYQLAKQHGVKRV